MPLRPALQLLLFSGGFTILSTGSFTSSVTADPQNNVWAAIDNLNWSVFGTVTNFSIRNALGGAIQYGFEIDGSGNVDIIENGATAIADVATVSLSSDDDFAIALDNNLIAHYYIYNSTQAEWERVAVGTFATSAASVYADITDTGATYTTNVERFGTGMPYETPISDSSPTDSETGDFPDGDTRGQITLPTAPTAANTISLDMRLSGSVYWQVRADAANYYIYQNGSVLRATSASAPGDGDLIQWRFAGNSLEIWINGVSEMVYASAITNLRETGYRINDTGDGAFSNLMVWKVYTRSGAGLGSELVTNGGFDTDTDWIKGAGWAIASGVATATGASSAIQQPAQDLDETKYHKITHDILNYASGTYILYLNGNSISGIAANGSYASYMIPGTANTIWGITGSSLNSDLDNVSIKHMLWSSDTLGQKLAQAVA